MIIDDSESSVAEEIARIIADYRRGHVPQRTQNHVIRFVDQINEICTWMGSSERFLFLQGLRTALTNSYWSASRIRMYMRPLLSMTGVNHGEEWVMLALQESESSQLRLVRDVELGDGLMVSSCFLETHDSYIYVDDAAYTGRTLVKYFQRIADEVSVMSRRPRQLVVWHLAEYSNETMGRLGEQLGRLQNLKVNVTFQRVEDFSTTTSGSKLGVLFPGSSCAESPIVQRFLKSRPNLRSIAHKPQLWRDESESFEDGLFASNEERSVVELAMLEVGCWIFMKVEKPLFRPLGYVANLNSDVSFGFGSMFATCHNSANTTPIAMWWGDPLKYPNSPLGVWNPLLPRYAG